jgi:MFS family permease
MFPWLKAEFGFNYAELGLLMTIFFVVSCIVQAASGFLVDRIGARPVLFTGIGLLALAALTYSQSNGYGMLVLGAVIAGCGNGIFHPVDYTLINHKISPANLPYAYSIHGVTGYLGWAAAPAFMVAMTAVFDWRIAFLGAAVLEALVLLILWINRARLVDDVKARREESQNDHAINNPGSAPLSTFGFMRLPAVWLCWIFFFFSMAATSGLQSFAPTALFKIYDLAVSSGNYYLTLMSMGGAGGMLFGAYLATRLKVPERIITICFTVNIVMGLLLATGLVPIEIIVIAFIVIGLGLGGLYFAIAPSKYEATVVIQPARMGSMLKVGAQEPEPAPLMVERLKQPGFWSEALREQCSIAPSDDYQKDMVDKINSNIVKLPISAAQNFTMAKITWKGISPSASGKCLEAVVAQLTQAQNQVNAPAIAMLEEHKARSQNLYNVYVDLYIFMYKSDCARTLPYPPVFPQGTFRSTTRFP